MDVFLIILSNTHHAGLLYFTIDMRGAVAPASLTIIFTKLLYLLNFTTVKRVDQSSIIQLLLNNIVLSLK